MFNNILMWVWDDSPSLAQLLNNTNNTTTKLINFINAPLGQAEHPITEVALQGRSYAYAKGTSNTNSVPLIAKTLADPLTDPTNSAMLHALIKNIKLNTGAAVTYLDGQAIWPKSATYAATPIAICKAVVTFNMNAASALEQFDGIHFDVEPWTLGSNSGWYANRPTYGLGYSTIWEGNWQNFLSQCKVALNNFNTACTIKSTGAPCTKMSMTIDVGDDFAYYDKSMQSYLNSTMATDRLAIMDYYNSLVVPNSVGSVLGGVNGVPIVGGMAQNLLATTLSKAHVGASNGASWAMPVIIGLETMPVSYVSANITFAAKSGYELFKVMAQAGHNYTASHYPGVAWGVAVHHYGSFSILPLNATVSCKLQTNSVTVSNADSSAWCFSLSADGTAAPTLIAPGASANIAGAESNIEVFLGLDPSQQICSEHFITIGCN